MSFYAPRIEFSLKNEPASGFLEEEAGMTRCIQNEMFACHCHVSLRKARFIENTLFPLWQRIII
jgi:hypothetical protein